MISSEYSGLPPREPLLVLNGAETRLSVTAVGQEGVLYEQQWRAPGKASRFLAPGVDAALDFLGLAPAELGGLAVVRGPGSFTGLRMTMAFCLGLARTAELPMAGIDYLPLLASGPGPLLRGTLVVAVHSRMREVYLQPFSCPDVHPLAQPGAVGLRDIPEIIADLPGPIRLAGSGLRRNAAFFSENVKNVAVLDSTWDEPSAELLARAALAAEYERAAPQPLYLRPSDAVENLSGIAAARGLNAEEAARWLDRGRGPLEDDAPLSD
jgi:tRNA threonylcarbamoyl adenosine modification protein YeaZ